MNETIFGMSSITYLIIGIIYASLSLNRHWNTSQEQNNKVSIWVLLCVFWIVFVLSDIIKQNKNYDNKDNHTKSTFIIQEGQIPLKVINYQLKKSGIISAETVLKIPYSGTNQIILEYKGNIEIIKSLTQKNDLIRNIIGYYDGFTSLSSMKQNIPESELSVYILWDSHDKLIGILTLTDNEPFIMNLYYGNALPDVFLQL